MPPGTDYVADRSVRAIVKHECCAVSLLVSLRWSKELPCALLQLIGCCGCTQQKTSLIMCRVYSAEPLSLKFCILASGFLTYVLDEHRASPSALAAPTCSVLAIDHRKNTCTALRKVKSEWVLVIRSSYWSDLSLALRHRLFVVIHLPCSCQVTAHPFMSTPFQSGHSLGA